MKKMLLATICLMVLTTTCNAGEIKRIGDGKKWNPYEHTKSPREINLEQTIIQQQQEIVRLKKQYESEKKKEKKINFNLNQKELEQLKTINELRAENQKLKDQVDRLFEIKQKARKSAAEKVKKLYKK